MSRHIGDIQLIVNVLFLSLDSRDFPLFAKTRVGVVVKCRYAIGMIHLSSWFAASLKYLRLATTAFSLFACVVLIALWVHSYSALDSWRGNVLIDRSIHMQSFKGHLMAFNIYGRHPNRLGSVPVSYLSDPSLGIAYDTSLPILGYRDNPLQKSWVRYLDADGFEKEKEVRERVESFYLEAIPKGTVIPKGISHRLFTVSHLVVMIPFALVAAVTWPKWQFSLRTLIIAFTVFSIVFTIVLRIR